VPVDELILGARVVERQRAGMDWKEGGQLTAKPRLRPFPSAQSQARPLNPGRIGVGD